MAGAPKERKWDFDRVFRLLLSAVTVVALFLLLRFLADVLIPFAVALLLAYLLNPIVTALASRFQRRTPAVLVTVFGCGAVVFAVGLMLFFIGSREVASVRELVAEFMRAPRRADVRSVRAAFESYVEQEDNPVLRALLVELRDRLTTAPASQWKYREELDAYIARLEVDPDRQADAEVMRQVRAKLHPADPAELRLREDLDRLLASADDPQERRLLGEAKQRLEFDDAADITVGSLVERGVRYVAPTLVNVFSGTLSLLLGLTGLVVILLYLVFLLIDYPLFVQTWKGFLPPKQRSDIVGFLDEFLLAMSRYFRGQFIIAMSVGILLAVGFSLIGLRLAVLLGLGIGLLNMVPYLQLVGVVPALLLGFVRGLESGQPLWLPPLLVLLVFAVVQLVQDGVLVPKIMGKSVGLRPVVILLGIFIWGKLLGFLGLLLAIPLTCLGLAYYRRFVLGDRTAKAIEDAGP